MSAHNQSMARLEVLYGFHRFAGQAIQMWVTELLSIQEFLDEACRTFPKEVPGYPQHQRPLFVSISHLPDETWSRRSREGDGGRNMNQLTILRHLSTQLNRWVIEQTWRNIKSPFCHVWRLLIRDGRTLDPRFISQPKCAPVFLTVNWCDRPKRQWFQRYGHNVSCTPQVAYEDTSSELLLGLKVIRNIHELHVKIHRQNCCWSWKWSVGNIHTYAIVNLHGHRWHQRVAPSSASRVKQ